jgi:hypothetical protein
LRDSMTECPRCTEARIMHSWRADMARLILIDEGKCLNRTCGHRWDASVSYDQLQGSVDTPLPVTSPHTP